MIRISRFGHRLTAVRACRAVHRHGQRHRLLMAQDISHLAIGYAERDATLLAGGIRWTRQTRLEVTPAGLGSQFAGVTLWLKINDNLKLKLTHMNHR